MGKYIIEFLVYAVPTILTVLFMRWQTKKTIMNMKRLTKETIEDIKNYKINREEF